MIEVGGSADNDNVHYWIKDNGVGIPPAAKRPCDPEKCPVGAVNR